MRVSPLLLSVAAVLASASLAHADPTEQRPGYVKLKEQIIVAKRMHPVAATEVAAVRVAIKPAERRIETTAKIEAAVTKDPFLRAIVLRGAGGE